MVTFGLNERIMRIFLLHIFCLGMLSAFAQESWTLYQPAGGDSVNGDTVLLDTIRNIEFNGNGQVTINKDPRLDNVTDLKRGNVNLTKPGYRVQIRLCQQKDEVNLLRAKFIQLYDNHNAHVQYNQPNFVLKVGDFYTRQQALEFKYDIAEHFPEAIVVRDNIELPKLQISDL